MEIKWEALQAKAKRAVSTAMRGNACAYTANSHDNLRIVMKALGDAIANAIAAKGNAPQLNAEAKIENVLQAWEVAAHGVIDDWDIRRVGKLVQLFPEIVPAKYRSASMTAELVDNEAGDDCEWVVYFTEPFGR